MKILQINTVCGVGSTGRIVADIHKLIQECNHSGFIAYAREDAEKADNILKIGNNAGIYRHFVLSRLWDMHGFGSKKATLQLIKKLSQIQPDIVHLHNIHGYYIHIKILFDYLKRAKVPVVWTLHDCWSFTGHCCYFDYADCYKWQTGCQNCSQIKSYPSSLFVDRSKENYRCKKEIFTGVENLTIVTPSRWLANKVKDSFLKEYPVSVIHNGIDLDVFKPTPSDFRKRYHLEDKFIVLGVAGLWQRRKGLEYFLEMEKRLKEEEIIVLVGVTKEQRRSLPPKIIGITKTNNTKELAQIYTAADIYVNPTLEDNFPTTNLEALACGTPVVTFNTGGSVESIHKETGAIAAKGDLVDLTEKIRILKSNLPSQEACVSHAQSFNKHTSFAKYINLYEQVGSAQFN